MAGDSLTCEDVLAPFEWLLATDSMTTETWRSVFCENSSTVMNVLLMDWWPLIHEVKFICLRSRVEILFSGTFLDIF